MISPNQINAACSNQYDNIVAIEKEIDRQIIMNHGDFPYEYAIINAVLSIQQRNYIKHKYMEGGWAYVYHRTSDENKELPGLTTFIFSNYALFNIP